MKSLVAAAAFTFTINISAGSLGHAQDAPRSSILAMSTADWTVDVVADNLDYPWDIERSGDRIFVTEAAGDVVVIRDGAVTRFRLQTSDPVARDGGGGLLGMALAADFETSGVAYFYHTYAPGGEIRNKVIEALFDGQSWRETRVLLDGIPGHRLYNGGRLAIGPDGNLYVTTGWTENGDLPQDIESLAGKVLRMTRQGTVPDDNPFKGSYVYSLGHRNPQGLAWNAEGQLFAAEHGQSGHDEINQIRPGLNYGWPLIDGDDRREAMETAALHSGNNTWAPSGITFRGDELLVATLVGRGIYVYDKTAGELKPIFVSGERFRDVLAVGDDLYVITTNRSPRGEGPSEDRLLKLTPTS